MAVFEAALISRSLPDLRGDEGPEAGDLDGEECRLVEESA